MKFLIGERAVKTYGWALISGLIFLGCGLVAEGELGAVSVGAGLAVALKTPFYWAWEHVFHWAWNRRTDPGREIEVSLDPRAPGWEGRP